MKAKLTLKQENLDKKQSNLNRKKSIKANYYWPFDLEHKTLKNFLGFAVVLLITMLFSNPLHAQVNITNTNQGLTVSGKVSDEEGPLLGVNIIQKGAEVGTTTDKNGTFTFPKALQPNDILVFTYLGYETQEISITKNTTRLEVVMLIDSIVMGGALAVDQPYKSKRSH